MSTTQPAHAPLPADLVDQGSHVVPACIAAFTEGPAVDPDGNVFFSDIHNNRILRLSAGGELTTFRESSGRANGNMFDHEGRLVTCEGAEFGPGGGRRLTRTNLSDGSIEVLTDRYEGKRYNSPNDVCIDTRGNIYFTDPRYGDQSGREMDVEGVYRVDTRGEVRRVLGKEDVQKPNGLAITPDDGTLYVVDSNPEAGGHRRIWAFTVDASDGSLADRRLVYDFAPGRGGDGMRLDTTGNLWIAAGINAARGPGENLDVPAGVYIVSPEGTLLGRIPIPEDLVTNLTFGPPDAKTLYVTAGKNLYTMRIEQSGYVLPWRRTATS